MLWIYYYVARSRLHVLKYMPFWKSWEDPTVASNCLPKSKPSVTLAWTCCNTNVLPVGDEHEWLGLTINAAIEIKASNDHVDYT